MVDFKKLVKRKQDIDVTDLTALFESLDRQTSHIELRPAQLEGLPLLSSWWKWSFIRVDHEEFEKYRFKSVKELISALRG